MAKRKKPVARKSRTKRKESLAVSPATGSQEPSDSAARGHWTLLFYMCGDNNILDDTKPGNQGSHIARGLAELCRVGSSPQVRIVVQCDRREGARRYVLPDGPCENPDFDPVFDNVRVNTGDPLEAIDFLRWGIGQAPSDHVAVIFSGLGINPAYVSELLTPQENRIGRSGAMATEQQIQARLFSICHDQTSHDALEAHELSEILEKIKEELGQTIDLVGLDMGVAAFVEIAYQIQDLAGVLVASQRPLPDAGWPYQKIVRGWQEQCQAGPAGADILAKLIVDAVADEFPDPVDDVRMVALRLEVLEPVARALDTLALAVMQNLGDWHILNAIRAAGQKTDWISREMSADMAVTSDDLPDQADFLPAVDMLELLENAHQALSVEAKTTPEEFGQRERIDRLRDLVETALSVLNPQKRNAPRLLLHSRPRLDRGLSILFPPPRTQEQINQRKGPDFSLSNSNYVALRFSRRVHWPAMVGAFKLIVEKPHTLWRLISSVLADASGAARDALLLRLTSSESVIGGLQSQFKALSSDAALTLSLEPKPAVDSGGGCEYQLRLESSQTGATVAEQNSRVYQTTIDAALEALEQLLQDPRGTVDLGRQLESLGRTLGEDLIQNLAERLHQERDALAEQSEGTPHLRLRIPPDLMRYPWELMHDRHGLLCERFAFGRQVFTGSEFARRRTARKPGAIRALVIGDPQFEQTFADQFQAEHGRPPLQLPGARGEAAAVVEAFQRLNEELAGMPLVEVKPIVGCRLSCFEMRDFLRSGEFDIIHFAGHAQFVKDDPEASAWLLSDGPLRARDIRNTLAWTDTPPWLVLANACEAGMDASRSVGRYQGDVHGLATAFINQAVAAYIAPLWPVDDRVATELAVSFYYSLLADRLSLGEALYRAKMTVRDELARRNGDDPDAVVVPREVLSWASVVLYGDPTRQLLESLWSPQSGQAAKPATPGIAGSDATAVDFLDTDIRPISPIRPSSPVKIESQRMRGFLSSVVPAAETVEEPRVYPVWFGTNRAPRDPADASRGFSARRDDQVHYGICNVVIPESHQFGSLGSAWWKRWLTWTDDRVRLIDTTVLAEALFWQSVRNELATRDKDDRVALVFLHGFNVTFEEAAVRAAQIGFDLKIPGLTAFFSWPSQGRVTGYVADGTSIEASERHIADFLVRFAADSGADRVHIIAHSMGNRGLLRSMHRITQQAAASARVPFNQILLAAPDVDAETFADLAQVYAQVAQRTTLYVSSKDLALASSGIVNDHPRAGYLPPVTIVDGIDTVEVSEIDLTLLGHSYYGGAEGVLYDMHELLTYNSPPQRRTRIKQLQTPDRRVYWSVQR